MDFNLPSIAKTDWQTWKNYLRQAMEFADELGIPRDKVHNLAHQVGDILAQSVPPANPEQQAVKELWQVADQNERQVLSRLMTRVVNQQTAM